MEILEAYDLTGSLRGAAALCGCDHKTVGLWVRTRDAAGGQPRPAGRARPVTGAFLEKVEELVDRSHGKIRADKTHERLVAMGYLGSARSTRRAVAEAKHRHRQKHGRRTRPWIAEPGLWMQWDYGEGPVVGGRATSLFCSWLAWSRFRVVLPLWDRTLPSVVMALDRALRRYGGAPTYALYEYVPRHIFGQNLPWHTTEVRKRRAVTRPERDQVHRADEAEERVAGMAKDHVERVERQLQALWRVDRLLVRPVDLRLMARRRLKALLRRLGLGRSRSLHVAAHSLIAAHKTVVACEILMDALCLKTRRGRQPLVDQRLEWVELRRCALAPIGRLRAFGQIALDGAPVAAHVAADLRVVQPLAVQGLDVHELLLVDQHASFRLARSGEPEGALKT